MMAHLSGRDDHESGFDIVVAHDPVIRRAEAIRLLRRALVELCFQAARSEMANPEKLAVLHELSRPAPAAFYDPDPATVVARRLELARLAELPMWTSEAVRFLSLAEDEYADAERKVLRATAA